MTLPYPPPFMDLATLAEHICCGESTIEKWVKEGEFPAPKQKNGKTVWKWSEVERHLSGEDTSRIYFIEFLDFIKIGFTTDLEGRFRSLSSSYPGPLVILHDMPGDFDLETDLHRKFKHLRTGGEWFRKSPELLAYIDLLKKDRV